jgi:outer membrane protein assembly factor BamD
MWTASTLLCPASLVWRPGEGWVDESGQAKAASSSREQLELAKKYEAAKDWDAALSNYRVLVRKWPLSFSAPEAQFKTGWCLEKKGEFWSAFKAYQKGVEKHPASTFFDQSIERILKIGDLHLAGEPQRIWKIPMGPSMEKTIDIYRVVLKSAPFGRYAPQAQYNIGMANLKMRKYDEAVKTFGSVMDRYPNSDVADDAQYQVGYCWLQAASTADYDQSAAEKAIEAFNDYVTKYPNSEKVAQAQDYIVMLSGRQTQGAYNIAKFYEKQRDLKAAFIYYNEVVRQDPTSAQAQLAKKKVQELRPLVEKDLKLPPLAAATPAAPVPTETSSTTPTTTTQ